MGVVLWECLAGRRLFRSEEAVDTLEEVMHGCVHPNGSGEFQLPGVLKITLRKVQVF